MASSQRIAFLHGAPGERALVARMRAGEELAFRECYELHAPGLLRLLGRVLRNGALAEEILQETFAAAFKALGEFRGEARLATWLTGIALRRGLNAIRGETRRAAHLPDPPEASASPEPWLADRHATRKVLALLDGMEEPKRVALLLQAEGHTAAEIAELTGEPRGTILSRLSRARAELAGLAAEAGLGDFAAMAKEGEP